MLKGNPNFQGMSSQTRLKTCFDFNKKIKNSLIKKSAYEQKSYGEMIKLIQLNQYRVARQRLALNF